MNRPGFARRGWFWAASSVVVAGLITFGFVWFQPHKLFIDERVVEAIPTATERADPDPTGPAGQVPAEPREMGRGEFVSLDKDTTGVARVLELADGRLILRLEGLDTGNGPDLFVYLTTNPADGPAGAFNDEFVDLGRLTANQGDQNYDLPADVVVDDFPTVVIWCERFTSAFGAADLSFAD